MGGTLRHLVVLRAVTLLTSKSTSPVLTCGDLPTIADVILPRLETLGLDVIWMYEESQSAKRHSLVAPSLLRTLYVGADHPNHWWEKFGAVAKSKFLKKHFPGLQYLYFHLFFSRDNLWMRVMDANGYSGGSYGPGGLHYLD